MKLDLSIAFQYKKNVASRLIPVPGNRISELIPESSEYYISEKLDGFLCIAACDGNSTKFFDQNGTELELPHLVNSFPKKAVGIWAGELYIAMDRSRSYLVSSALAKNSSILSLGIFDLANEIGQSISERYEKIRKCFSEKGSVHVISVEQASSRKSIQERFQSITNNGGEGVVVHTSTGIGYKIKPLQSIDCIVLGYAVRENKSQMREMLIGLATENGYKIIGKVSNGFSESDRIEWLSRLEKIKVNSATLEIAGNGLAFNWVKPEIVIEVTCQEIIFETTSGTIRKAELEFNKTGYSEGKSTSSFSLIHPVFTQERKDKKPIADHCGFRQINFLEKDFTSYSLPDVKSEAATCLAREVYIKIGKTGKAIRKFTLWKSPKNDIKRSPFMVYYTDFSVGRKEPLQTEIYVFQSEESARKRIADLKEENIKKGWEKVEK